MTTKTVSAKAQFDRIANLLNHSMPNAELFLLSDPDSAFLRFQMSRHAGEVYHSHDLDVSELAVMSDMEIWDLLGYLSHGRIRPSST